MPDRRSQRPPAESLPVRPRPEEYISELIKAINDNAKIARTTGLALLLTGLYIAAAIFSATDEAILRGSAAKVGQLGIDIPLVLSFSLAPPVFVFLHVNALIQFDLLARQLRRLQSQFDERGVGEADRAHYVSLLTSAAFVPLAAMRQPGIGELYKDKVRRAIYAGVEWLTITGLPVATLLVAQLGFLRQQDEAITAMHTIVLAVDLIALLWFYGRRPVSRPIAQLLRRLVPAKSKSNLGRGVDAMAVAHWPSPVGAGAAMAILAFTVAYGQVPGPESFSALGMRAANASFQPVDSLLCPRVSARFCRRLALSNKTLVANEPDPGALSALRDMQDVYKHVTGVIGLDLRGRSLRFADLEGAGLWRANLSEADLTGAKLDRAGLAGAILSGGRFVRASMTGANLAYSELVSADLRDARLFGAELSQSAMQMATMSRADLRVANFRDARMDGIDLEEARLIGACMKGVSLRGAWLAGADLRGAKIRGANLTGATLANALVWRAGGDGGTSLGPTDLRGITVARGPGSPLDAISDAAFGPLFREVERECEPQDTRDRFTRDIADDGSTGPFEKASSNGNVLIAVELDGAVRKNIAGGSGLTTDPGEFALAIAGFQRSVACVDLALALSVRTYGLDDLVLAELARNSRTSGCSFDPSGAQRFRRR